MILYPYFMLNGFELYRDIINPYFPFLNLILAGYFNLVGISVLNLKIFTFFVVSITDLLVFYISLKITKKINLALLSLVAYIMMQYLYGGNGLWFEIVVTPFILAGLNTIYFANNLKTLLIGSILLSLAFLIKQNAIFFFLPPLILFLKEHSFKKIIYLAIPGLATVILLLFYLFQKNLINDFIHWTILLPISFSSQPGYLNLPVLRQILLSLIPLVSLFGTLKLKNNYYWIISLFIAYIFIFPRYENFHLQILVAISALFIPLLNKKVLLFILVTFFTLFVMRIGKDWKAEDRFIDDNMMKLSSKISEYESVYLLNSPELAYFYAKKTPPKPWATNFPWYFEQVKFQEKYIEGLRIYKPDFIIVGDKIGGNKFDLGNYYPENVWNYIQANYQISEIYNQYQIYKIKK